MLIVCLEPVMTLCSTQVSDQALSCGLQWGIIGEGADSSVCLSSILALSLLLDCESSRNRRVLVTAVSQHSLVWSLAQSRDSLSAR